MTNLNRNPPRLFASFSRPSYPRTVGIGALLFASACARTASDAPNASDSASTSAVPVAPAGTTAPVMDEQPRDAGTPAVADGAASGANHPDMMPQLGGAKPAPFDSAK